jgi:hypothetical protein
MNGVSVVKVLLIGPLMALAAGGAAAQQREPLRKGDLVRLLSGGAVSKGEIADLVRRSCLSFTPTARDLTDFRALGADSAIMLRIDECARRGMAGLATRPGGRPTTTTPSDSVRPRPSRSDSVRPRPSPPAPPTPPRPSRVISPERTGFVSGSGQRGRVGTELPLPVVFEVRDAANLPLAGQEVRFSGTNARVVPDRGITDSAGQARATVVLGSLAQAATVRARAGMVDRQVSLTALAGPPARVVVHCGAEPVAGRVQVRAGAAARLEVAVHDAFGNELPVTGLRAAVGDERSLRVTDVTAEGGRGILTIDGRRAGATNLAVFASGLREGLTVAVMAAGPMGCSLDTSRPPS